MAIDWRTLSHEASFQSHRLVGWMYWDPEAIAGYAALGVPDGAGYYIASRAAPLAPAGHQAVAAAFGSIHPGFIELALTLSAQHTDPTATMVARNTAVGAGLRRYVPEIVEPLAAMGPALWAAADAAPAMGKVLFAAHRQAPRSDDPVVSAWLAVNCIREYRGDVHWAVLVAEDVSDVQAGILHDAHLQYSDDNWIPKSRGADEPAVAAALAELADRGLAERGADGRIRVNDAGRALRDRIEERTDLVSARPWQLLGADGTQAFIDLVAPVGDRLVDRIDATAGPMWMPAARRARA